MFLLITYLHRSTYKPSATHNSLICSDGGLTLKTSTFILSTVANLTYQIQMFVFHHYFQDAVQKRSPDPPFNSTIYEGCIFGGFPANQTSVSFMSPS